MAPICAAFCSSAVADMCADGDGDGGGSCCCCRSAAGAENWADAASVARHSDGGLAASAHSGYCGAWATEDGANMLPRRLCDVAELLLVLALALPPLTEVGEGISGAGGVYWTTGSDAAAPISRSG